MKISSKTDKLVETHFNNQKQQKKTFDVVYMKIQGF